jgi:hypothetical protein
MLAAMLRVYGCCDVEALLCDSVCVIKGVVFAFFFSREKRNGRKKERKNLLSGIFSEESETIFEVQRNCVTLHTLHKIRLANLISYPERQIHQNDEKFNDRTARIHFNFFFFASPSFNSQLFRFFFTKEFSFLLSTEKLFPSFTNLSLFLFSLYFLPSTYHETIRVANDRKIQMFTSDWIEEILFVGCSARERKKREK